MFIRSVLVFSMLISFSGCAKSVRKMGSLQIGMSKDQVIGVLGEPFRVSVKDDVEQLTFILSQHNDYLLGAGDEYFVQFEDGKVVGYGHRDDFR